MRGLVPGSLVLGDILAFLPGSPSCFGFPNAPHRKPLRWAHGVWSVGGSVGLA